jgi:hypothetical protein
MKLILCYLAAGAGLLLAFLVREKLYHSPWFVKKILHRKKIVLKAIQSYEDIWPPFMFCPVCMEQIDYECTVDGNLRKLSQDDIFHCYKCGLDLKGFNRE